MAVLSAIELCMDNEFAKNNYLIALGCGHGDTHK